MKLMLPELEYGYDALQPYIDEPTMKLHHDKHHKTYVDKALAALKDTPLEDAPVEEILANIDSLPEDRRTAVRNNVGGHANHSLFWRIMGPATGSGPAGPLAQALTGSFGGDTQFREEFAKAATGVFGSGWAWLVADASGLRITTTPNQDSPLMSGATPILGLDVWEHAYYLNYQNRRPDYIEAWWNVVNWERVGGLFDGAHDVAGSGRTAA